MKRVFTTFPTPSQVNEALPQHFPVFLSAAPMMEVRAPVKKNSREQKPFRFMDMPREMRDEVYDNLLVGNVELPAAAPCGLAVFVHDGPEAAMLQVSRQFSKEYSEAVTRNAVIVMTDIYGAIPERISIMKGALNSITEAEIKIRITCIWCESGRHHVTPDVSCLNSDIREHYAWLARMKDDLPQILSSKLTVCLVNAPHLPTWPEGVPSLPDLSDHVAMLASAEVPGLQQITVFWGKGDTRQEMSPDWREIEVVGQYCKWTKEDGWSAA